MMDYVKKADKKFYNWIFQPNISMWVTPQMYESSIIVTYIFMG